MTFVNLARAFLVRALTLLMVGPIVTEIVVS